MENYIEVIVILTPGFVAKEVANLLGGNTYITKKSAMEQVINYFVYSVFALVLLCGFLFGIEDYLEIYSKNRIIHYLAILICSILSGVLTGAMWQLVIKKVIRKIGAKFTKVDFITETDLLNRAVRNEEDHLVKIETKEGKILIGKMIGASDPQEIKSEIKIDNHPDYARWLYRCKDDFPIKYSLINFTDGYILTEYEDRQQHIFRKERSFFARWMRLFSLRRRRWRRWRRWCRRSSLLPTSLLIPFFEIYKIFGRGRRFIRHLINSFLRSIS